MNQIIRTLDHEEMQEVMEHFPDIELSYETVPHKKVSKSYNLCVAIPYGDKKVFVWFTYLGDRDVCFTLELNRYKKVTKVNLVIMDVPLILAKNTIFYGTILENGIFIMEDIYYYQGETMKSLYFGEKLGFMELFFKDLAKWSNTTFDEDTLKIPYEMGKDLAPKFLKVFHLPYMWTISNNESYECCYAVPSKYLMEGCYEIHHTQFRCLSELAPYMNTFPVRKNIIKKVEDNSKIMMMMQNRKNPKFRMDFKKPQYKMKTVFIVNADLQYDVYHLRAYGRNKSLIYYDVAYIPNYDCSVYMNKLFRHIKENLNLDYIEESDDEEEFENIALDKYVDLDKSLMMEFSFHSKFKKWVPQKVLQGNQKVVHINQLVNGYQ